MPVFSDFSVVEPDMGGSVLVASSQNSYCRLEIAEDKYRFECKSCLNGIGSLAVQTGQEPGMTWPWLLSYRNVVDMDSDDDESDKEEIASTNPLIALARANHGEYSFDQEVFNQVKEEWVKRQLIEREAKYITFNELELFVGTWNVNGKVPAEDLAPWLHSYTRAPHLFVLGFQETDLSAEAFLLNTNTHQGAWENLIEKSLSRDRTGHDYIHVASKQLVGMLICVYARADIHSLISEVATSSVGVGILGVMGNKGGVAVRMQIQDSSIAFINSHLAAHFGNWQERNNNQIEIARRIQFQLPHEERGLYEHDQLFWLGDLNYRINLSDMEVKTKVLQEDWTFLQAYDQLKLQMLSHSAFEGFIEQELNFCPTYKYDPGTDNWESSKVRSPAWCDRVLFKGEYIEPRFYGRHSLYTSDHKPVSARFKIKYRMVQADQQERILNEIVRDLDAFENECTPVATLSSQQVTFPRVRFGNTSSSVLTLTNTGNVMVFFKFLERPDGLVTPPWINIFPTEGTIIPGEKRNLLFECNLSEENVQEAAEKRRGDEVLLHEALKRQLIDVVERHLYTSDSYTMEDILVLHLVGGKDFFVSVNATQLPTIMGRSLISLITNPEPPRQHRQDGTGSSVFAPEDMHDTKANRRQTIRIGRVPTLGFKSEHARVPLSDADLLVAYDIEEGRHVTPSTRDLLCDNSQPSSASLMPPAAADKWRQGPGRKFSNIKLPVILTRLCEAILRSDFVAADLLFEFDRPPRDRCSLIRDCIDLGVEFPLTLLRPSPETSAVVCEDFSFVLMQWLACLPQPIIPETLYLDCMEGAFKDKAASKAVQFLPHQHRMVLVYLTSFLNFICQNSSHKVPDIAMKFGNELFRGPTDGSNTMRKAVFMAHFINDNSLIAEGVM